MNYFPFYSDPVASAQALDDKRVRRSYMQGVDTLRDHPVGRTMWLSSRNEPDTFKWFVEWVRALRDEVDYRFGDVTRYQCEATYQALPIARREAILPCDPMLFNNAKSCVKATRPADFTHLPLHEAYQRYAVYRWKNIDKRAPLWTERKKPDFYARY